MNASELNNLRQRARTQGIQLSYLNMAGEEQTASPETLQALLDLLEGPEPGTPGQRALHAWIEPVAVMWDGKPIRVTVRSHAEKTTRNTQIRLIQEDGQQTKLVLDGVKTTAGRRGQVDGGSYFERQIALPPLPLGYHRIQLETTEGLSELLIVSAPTRSYSEPDQAPRWGVFLPMYAAHSRQSWGAGNLGDWQQLSDWIAELGGDIVASLPLLAAFLDCPVCEPSPYSPASRLFWNEFYLDVERVPEFANSAAAQKLVRSSAFQRKLGAFRSDPEIDYAAQMALRRQVLELLAEGFFAQTNEQRRAFNQFLRNRPEVTEYASFRAACEQAQGSWHSWPERQRKGRLQPRDFDPRQQQYFAYVQWLAQEQMQALVGHCRSRGVQFYLDLPLGVHPDGYDAWREQEAFALGASVGAPPDPFFSKGQDWGFSPLHPRQIRQQHYRYVLEYLRFQMRHTGLLRIDHVMGLHRLYWVPKGLPPSQGAYVSYPADELYALLSLESHRHKTTLVGENLGTVPPQVNRSMQRHRLRQMYVVQYEQRPDPRQALREPPRQSVASINTHDMPTFAAHWRGLDIADRADLGLIPKGKLGALRAERQKVRAALVRFLQRNGSLSKRAKHPKTEAVLRGCLDWLSRSPAEVVLINLEDLWLEEAPQNVPGTYKERPNWRRKARWTIEDIQAAAELRQFLEQIESARSECTL